MVFESESLGFLLDFSDRLVQICRNLLEVFQKGLLGVRQVDFVEKILGVAQKLGVPSLQTRVT